MFPSLSSLSGRVRTRWGERSAVLRNILQTVGQIWSSRNGCSRILHHIRCCKCLHNRNNESDLRSREGLGFSSDACAFYVFNANLQTALLSSFTSSVSRRASSCLRKEAGGRVYRGWRWLYLSLLCLLGDISLFPTLFSRKTRNSS